MTLAIEFAVEDQAWLRAAPWYREVALRAAECTLRAAGVKQQDVEISALLCSDARISELNGAFREKAGPTNVLSWPAETIAPGDAPVVAEDGCLGDIALARETIETEAAAQHKTTEAHFAHLLAHGVLHLLGYDHETDDDAAVMEGLERVALAAMGLADPYAGDVHDQSPMPITNAGK